MNIENMGLNNKPTLKSVAIYARVSTKEQEK
jgi:predicted site-specific integrase-resolvase